MNNIADTAKIFQNAEKKLNKIRIESFYAHPGYEIEEETEEYGMYLVVEVKGEHSFKTQKEFDKWMGTFTEELEKSIVRINVDYNSTKNDFDAIFYLFNI